MRICKTSEYLTIVIDSFIFVIFVTPYTECTARTILECMNNVKNESLNMGNEGRNRKVVNRI